MKSTAIVLAAGKGSRMKTDIAKQFLKIKDKPVLYYSLKAFENSRVDEIILVVGEGEQEYCKREIVDMHHIQKVTQIVVGGKERYDSVMRALEAIVDTDIVLVHDGARPFISVELINQLLLETVQYESCILAVMAKDTIKIADEIGFVQQTPQRNRVYQVQTPQGFYYKDLVQAYQYLRESLNNENGLDVQITDDAMVIEQFMNKRVKLVQGDYTNIKITTPEDLLIADIFLEKRNIKKSEKDVDTNQFLC